MTRKRKQTEQASVILEELPSDPEVLSDEEAADAKGGFFRLPVFVDVALRKSLEEATKDVEAEDNEIQ